MLLGLRDAQNFLDGRRSRLDLDPSVVAQGAHAVFDGFVRDGRGRGAVHHQRANRFADKQQFVNSQPALITERPAIFAPGPFVERGRVNFVLGKTDLAQVIALHCLRRFAGWTNGANKALRHDRLDGGGDEKWLDAHVDQTGECAWGVVRVQRRKNQVTRQRSANGNLRRFEVANFADHDDVRILAKNMAQAHRKRQSDITAHRNLIDAFELVLDRLFDRDNSFGDRIDRAQKRVERRGFTGAGRSRHEQNAVWLDDDLAERGLLLGIEPELVERQKNFSARQQTQRNTLTIDRGHGRDTDIDFLAFDANVDASVLGQALFGNVHSRHDLDAGNDCRLVALQLGRHWRLVQNAIDAVADAQFIFRRLEMNVRRTVLVRFPNDLVDELDDASLLIAFGNLFVAQIKIDRLVVVLGQLVEGLPAAARKFFFSFFH